MKLWLDDERPAPDGWVRVSSVLEALQILGARTDIEEISLDHDLAEFDPLEGTEATGYTLLCTLEQWAEAGDVDHIPAVIQVHSPNPVGRMNMKAAIQSIESYREGS